MVLMRRSSETKFWPRRRYSLYLTVSVYKSGNRSGFVSSSRALFVAACTRFVLSQGQQISSQESTDDQVGLINQQDVDRMPRKD